MESQELTIGDIVDSVSLRTRLLAGEGGRERRVVWAHSCELANPYEWLGSHELLMTVGLCVPEEPKDQRAFIATLADGGLAGIALGDHATLPVVSAEMIEEANARNFPVLRTEASVPFAAIGRMIASATATTQTQQVLKLSKLYQVSTLAHTAPEEFIAQLEVLFRVRLRVVDTKTRTTLLQSSGLRDDDLSTAERSYPLPGNDSAHLELVEDSGERLSSFMLVHILQVLDVAAHDVLGTCRFRMESAQRMLQMILDGMAPRDLTAVLNADDIAGGFYLVATPPSAIRQVLLAIALEQQPVLAGESKEGALIIVPAVQLDAVRQLLTTLEVQAGVSTWYRDLRDAPFATKEGLKALSSAGSRLWTEFSGIDIAILTRSHREVTEIVERVLGQLSLNDTKAETLRRTLFAFISHDRHWQSTANHLGIHRQTLAYRLARIREITGRDVSTSTGLAECWLAMQAWSTYDAATE